MPYQSTGGQAPPASLGDALFQGLAPDGGLYMPAAPPVLSNDNLTRLADLDWPDLAVEVAQTLFSQDLDPEKIDSVTRQALDFPVPLVQLTERIFALELFRGPTLAFKDVGARFLARLMSHFMEERDSPITVLTATSGDTGGAVAQALHGIPRLRVVVLFPDGKVTPRQERQFSTLGGNVTAVAVQGDFDDCQRLAKEAFQWEVHSSPRGSTAGEAQPEGSGTYRGPGNQRPCLTSANSINVGRFLPQTTYFLEAWARLRKLEKNRTQILFSVPSGNFGNLAAGLMARSMGMSGVSFLAATNINDVVPEYLRTGRFTPRPSVPTISSAMDVGNPSNLDRILHLYREAPHNLGEDLTGRRVTDRETRECIRRVYSETGYVLDPHSSVGFVALERELTTRPGHKGVLLATAHPAKFAEVVEPVLDTSLPLPPELSRCMDAERRVVPVEPSLSALQEVLALT